MNRNRAILLAVIQVTLVLTIAGKYLYERKTCPRVWVRTAQFDPNMPLRGRYLSLQLSVDACGLAKDGEHRFTDSYGTHHEDFWAWQVKPVAKGGKLVAVAATSADRPELLERVEIRGRTACDRVALGSPVEYFIADNARTPFPLQTGQELWVEVTVPPSGPPRPIQLATSKAGVFTPVKLD